MPGNPKRARISKITSFFNASSGGATAPSGGSPPTTTSDAPGVVTSASTGACDGPAAASSDAPAPSRGSPPTTTSDAPGVVTSASTGACDGPAAASSDAPAPSRGSPPTTTSDAPGGVVTSASAGACDGPAAASSDTPAPTRGSTIDILHYGNPNQPDPLTIPVFRATSQNVRFQQKWYESFPWIHYVPLQKHVICFSCAKADAMGLLSLAKSKDGALISGGFVNWKKATDKFDKHQLSQTHRFAVAQLTARTGEDVSGQLDASWKADQAAARESLVRVFTSIRYLLRQGLAFRGHLPEEGNFNQLLWLRAEDSTDFKRHLKRSTNFTSPQAQEEMMQLISHKLVREIVQTIKHDGMFSIMVDGIQDVSGDEQESICFRHIDSDLAVHEDFIGLYELPETTGKALSNMVLDVITRLDLSLEGLRAQTYDGASNMSGIYSGCQALIKQHQPLALYFHCGAHMSNLVIQQSVCANPTVRDAIQWVHELGVLFTRSRKFKTLFASLACNIADPDASPNTSVLRPLCPTRWLCRFPAIQAAIDQYRSILNSLHEMSSQGSGDTAAKANGLLDRFHKGVTLLGLMVAARPFAVLEQLNAALQARSMTVTGMLGAVSVCTVQLQRWRTEESFRELFAKVNVLVGLYELDPLVIPRFRQPPRRYTGPAAMYEATSAEEYYRSSYFEFIDTLERNLSTRFDPAKSGLAEYMELEQMITSGEVDRNVCAKYKELDARMLKMQLEMFRNTTKAETLHCAKIAYRDMVAEVRALFPQVFLLIKLLLVCPVTSSECERSFSALKRLKTWLRNTISQQRLNYASVCHVHKKKLDEVEILELSKEFAERSQTRRSLFGNF